MTVVIRKLDPDEPFERRRRFPRPQSHAGAPRYWTRERVLRALADFYLEYGEAPLRFDGWTLCIQPLNRAALEKGEFRAPYPSSHRLQSLFASMREAWAAAADAYLPPAAPGDPQHPWELQQRQHSGPAFHPRCTREHPCAWCYQWSPEELAYLRSRVGKVGLPELTLELNARYPDRRAPFTENSINNACKRILRISEKLDSDEFWTLMQVERGLGVDHRIIINRWIKPGFLPARRRMLRRGMQRTSGVEWLIRPMDVIRFLYVHTWAYSPATLKEPFASIGRHAWLLTPVVGLQELREYLGHQTMVFWKRRGGVAEIAPHLIRFHGSAAGQGSPMFFLSELPRIKERALEREKRRRSESARARMRQRNGGRYVRDDHES